jgi:acetyl esterase/lipase
MISHYDQADQKDPEVDEEILEAPAQDGTLLPVKVFRPVATDKDATGLPLIVLYFAGGFIMGSPTTLTPLARLLVKQFNAVVVAPTHRLAPEHPFPTSVNDSWDTFSWIAANARSAFRADPSKGFIVGGVSSGSNISVVISHLARDTGLLPPITGVFLCCGGVRLAPKDADKLPEKYRERNLSRTQDSCVNSVITSSGLSKVGKEALKPDYNSKLYAPLIWPTEAGHKGLPKTYSQVCGMEGSRDEELIYDDMMKNEGIPTRLDLYPGLPHVFWHSFKDLPESKGWEKDTLDGFAWLLEH